MALHKIRLWAQRTDCVDEYAEKGSHCQYLSAGFPSPEPCLSGDFATGGCASRLLGGNRAGRRASEPGGISAQDSPQACHRLSTSFRLVARIFSIPGLPLRRSCRCDVPVCAEHVLRIPLRFDLGKPRKSLAKRCLDAFGTFIFRQEIDVRAARRE
jgi:hypothetical protein